MSKHMPDVDFHRLLMSHASHVRDLMHASSTLAKIKRGETVVLKASTFSAARSLTEAEVQATVNDLTLHTTVERGDIVRDALARAEGDPVKYGMLMIQADLDVLGYLRDIH